MLDTCTLSLAPFFALALDVILVIFFCIMASRVPRSLRWRVGAMALVYALTIPIELARYLEVGSHWRGVGNLCWNSALILGVGFLAGLPIRFSLILFGGSLVIIFIPLLLGVPHPVVDSASNGLLSVTGFVLMGRLYLRTRGFGSGNLAATWLLFLVHGACFHLVVGGGQLTLAYGFTLAVLILWCQAVFGYMYLPRELEGRIPVRLPWPYLAATVALGVVTLATFNVMAPRLVGTDHDTWIGPLGLLAVAGVLLPLIIAWIRHRLSLTAYADEVEARLELRTEETRRQHALLQQQHVLLEQKATELAVLASTDALTGAPNRREGRLKLVGECARAQRYGSELSCILFDIDHFKDVNDQHGHDIGDLVLISVAQGLLSGVRQTDFFCRYGGEEFLVVCPGIGGEGADLLANRLREKVADPSHTHGLHVTISGGVAVFCEGDGPDELLKRADEGLYRAKESGRNRIEPAS